MEIRLGTKVTTLVDKHVEKGNNVDVFLRKGLVGYVCDTEYIEKGFVMVQFFEKDIVGKGTGVYSYEIGEITIDE